MMDVNRDKIYSLLVSTQKRQKMVEKIYFFLVCGRSYLNAKECTELITVLFSKR